MRDILALSRAQEEIFLPEEEYNDDFERRRAPLHALIGRVATATNTHFERRFGESAGICDVEGTGMWAVDKDNEDSVQISVHRIRKPNHSYSRFSVDLRPAPGEFEWQQDFDPAIRKKVDASHEHIADFVTDRDGRATITLYPATEDGEREQVQLEADMLDSEYDRYLPQAERVVAAIEKALAPLPKR